MKEAGTALVCLGWFVLLAGVMGLVYTLVKAPSRGIMPDKGQMLRIVLVVLLSSTAIFWVAIVLLGRAP